MAQGETGTHRNVLKVLNDLEALILYLVWDSKSELTYAEIGEALAQEGHKKSPGYIRRIVNTLSPYFENSTKMGDAKTTLAFRIRRDGFNSRPLTSRILLELLEQEHEVRESIDRKEFIDHVLSLKLRTKKKTHAVDEGDVKKTLNFALANKYIEESSDGTIRSADRTRQEKPFMLLISLDGSRPKREGRGSKRRKGDWRKEEDAVQSRRAQERYLSANRVPTLIISIRVEPEVPEV